MKVYVLLLEVDYEGSEIQSVHATEERAEAARLSRGKPPRYQSLCVEEWEVEE